MSGYEAEFLAYAAPYRLFHWLDVNANIVVDLAQEQDGRVHNQCHCLFKLDNRMNVVQAYRVEGGVGMNAPNVEHTVLDVDHVARVHSLKEEVDVKSVNRCRATAELPIEGLYNVSGDHCLI